MKLVFIAPEELHLSSKMPFIEALNPSSIRAIAQLATQLWPDSSMEEMEAHYEDVLKQN